MGLVSLSVTHKDIDYLCCVGSFCVTCSAFKHSADLKYIYQQKIVVVQQLLFGQ